MRNTSDSETARYHPGKVETLSNLLQVFAGQILTLCWPRQCFVCGENSRLQTVCTHCLPSLPWLDRAALCPQCALPTPHGGLCGRCLKRSPSFDATHALFAYARPIREMVLALKHGGGFAQIDWLGVLLAKRLSEEELQPDLIVPMPLHPGRLAVRGFNQSGELAKRLPKAANTRVLLDLAVRDTDTPKLEGLRQKERLRAVRGAFRCREAVTGAHVLIVDDVMTSGASLNELARTLKASGARRVSALVVARTLQQVRK